MILRVQTPNEKVNWIFIISPFSRKSVLVQSINCETIGKGLHSTWPAEVRWGSAILSQEPAVLIQRALNYIGRGKGIKLDLIEDALGNGITMWRAKPSAQTRSNCTSLGAPRTSPGAQHKCPYMTTCNMGNKEEELEMLACLQHYNLISIRETRWKDSCDWCWIRRT